MGLSLDDSGYHNHGEVSHPGILRSEFLAEAGELIDGERARTYGPPRPSFTRIADLWNALGVRMTVGDGIQAPLTAEDVARMFILMKVSRSQGNSATPGIDDWVDIIGYAALGGEMATGA